MKLRIYLILGLSLLLTNWSSSDSVNSLDGEFKFTLDGYYDFTPVTETDDPFMFWIANIENNGSTTYKISRQLKRVGSNPIFNQDAVNIELSINIVGPLEANHTYSITACKIECLGLPYNDNNAELLGCNSLDLGKDLTTTGQIKITSFDGNNLSGTFYFNNLVNSISNQQYSALWGCSSFPAQQHFTISNGIFTNIPKF